MLLSVWALSPLALLADPALFGLFDAHADLAGFVHNVALLWMGVGVAAVLFRTVQLFFLKDVQTGLVWLAKILTDPFHDVALYWRAPGRLLRGEWLDPMVPREAA